MFRRNLTLSRRMRGDFVKENYENKGIADCAAGRLEIGVDELEAYLAQGYELVDVRDELSYA